MVKFTIKWSTLKKPKPNQKAQPTKKQNKKAKKPTKQIRKQTNKKPQPQTKPTIWKLQTENTTLQGVFNHTITLFQDRSKHQSDI